MRKIRRFIRYHKGLIKELNDHGSSRRKQHKKWNSFKEVSCVPTQKRNPHCVDNSESIVYRWTRLDQYVCSNPIWERQANQLELECGFPNSWENVHFVSVHVVRTITVLDSFIDFSTEIVRREETIMVNTEANETVNKWTILIV